MEGRIQGLEGIRVLEIGAGNGYFAGWLLERRRGERPSPYVVSDLSRGLLGIARDRHRVLWARYVRLDVGRSWPFPDSSFDLVLATMVLHPRFVYALNRRGQVGRRGGGRGPTTMPGPEGLRLPVVPRELDEYEAELRRARLAFERIEVAPTPQVLAEKPGLRSAGRGPIAVVYDARARKLRS